MAHRKIERTSANTLEEVEGLLLQIGIKRFLTSSVWMSSIAISPILGKTWFVNLLKVFASALTLFFQKLFWSRSLTQFKAHWLKLTFCFSFKNKSLFWTKKSLFPGDHVKNGWPFRWPFNHGCMWTYVDTYEPYLSQILCNNENFRGFADTYEHM